MLSYVTMKRMIQFFASTIFVITLLAVYLVFKLTLNNTITKRNVLQKRTVREYKHDGNYHLHFNIKNDERSSTTLVRTRKFNGTIIRRKKSRNGTFIHEPQTRHLKKKKVLLRSKPGNFHIGKADVKVNRPFESARRQIKRLSTTATILKDKPHLDDKQHF